MYTDFDQGITNVYTELNPLVPVDILPFSCLNWKDATNLTRTYKECNNRRFNQLLSTTCSAVVIMDSLPSAKWPFQLNSFLYT